MSIFQKLSKIIHLFSVKFKFLDLFFGRKQLHHFGPETLDTKTAESTNSIKCQSRIKWRFSPLIKFSEIVHHFLLLFQIFNCPFTIQFFFLFTLCVSPPFRFGSINFYPRKRSPVLFFFTSMTFARLAGSKFVNLKSCNRLLNFFINTKAKAVSNFIYLRSSLLPRNFLFRFNWLSLFLRRRFWIKIWFFWIHMIKKFSSPKIKIWFEPMFFSGFFCGFKRCGSAAFPDLRGGIFSEKCVRTNSRILHQTGKVKEFWFASLRSATNWYSILGVKTNWRFRILGEEFF